MNIKKLKVRPKKFKGASPCAPELASMLGCWATSQDLFSSGPCAEHAKALFECMRTAPAVGKPHRPTINYHLARLGKNIK